MAVITIWHFSNAEYDQLLTDINGKLALDSQLVGKQGLRAENIIVDQDFAGWTNLPTWI